MRTRKIIAAVLCALILLAAAGGGFLYFLLNSQSTVAEELKDRLKILACDIRIKKLKDETEDIVAGDTVFDDGAKKIIKTDLGVRLIHYASGYYMDLPEDTRFDLSCSPDFIKAECGSYELTVSREYAPERDVREYTAFYLDRFLLDEDYRAANRIELLEKRTDTGEDRDMFSARLLEYGDGYDGYTYADVYTGTRIFYRLTFKYDGGDFAELHPEIENTVSRFTYFRPHGEDSYSVRFNNLGGHDLSDEAKTVYDELCGTDGIYWGIFTSDISGKGIDETLPKYEEDLDYEFSVILVYCHFGDGFPTELAEKCREDGKILELTYQPTLSNNEDLTGRTPQLDIYRGLCDDEIRKFAREAAEFGHPFMFRFGNEMNSDWTSYSGVVNMSDPDIYREVWQRIYRIFSEEGATNAIWIYNPNDREFPPCSWNNFLAYYPGDEYVHVIGITGYNNGTYYKKAHNESWREFKDIYDGIEKEYMPFFSDFPWMITEFASSSIGGDKAKWITGMFEDIHRHKNIKAAVWFDNADYDPAYGEDKVVSRPYWLCENEEITDAVRRGFAAQEQTLWNWREHDG